MKNALICLLVVILMLSLCSCGGTEPGTATDTQTGAPAVSTGGKNTGGGENSDSNGTWEPLSSVPNQVITHDAIEGKLIIYDMDLLEEDNTNLDDAEIWSFPVREHGLGGGTGVKYREDTVFGDVIIVASSGGAMMISYPDGKVLWKVDYCGDNPHSIEILPSGNIICASTLPDSKIFLFHTSQLLKGNEAAANKYDTYSLLDVHGVLWDPSENLLWALGSEELVAYVVSGSPETEKLTKMGGVGGTLPTKGGHDLAADFTDKGYLYLSTEKGVYRFCKETNEFDSKYSNYAKISMNNVKGVGNNPNGNFFTSVADGGKGTSWENESFAAWSTNTIYYFYWKSEHFLYRKACVSEKDCSFYKARVFYGQYQ